MIQIMNSEPSGTIMDALRDTRVSFNTVPVNTGFLNPLYRNYQDTPGVDARVKTLQFSQLLAYHRGNNPRETQDTRRIPYNDRTPQRILF